MEVIVDLPFWSLMTVVVFGFVTRFLSTVMNPTVAQYLYLGTMLWEIIRITQYSMSLGALWNVWSHNFSNMFITPLSMPEYILAQILSAAAKAIVLFIVVALVAAALFDFNVLSMGLGQSDAAVSQSAVVRVFDRAVHPGDHFAPGHAHPGAGVGPGADLPAAHRGVLPAQRDAAAAAGGGAPVPANVRLRGRPRRPANRRHSAGPTSAPPPPRTSSTSPCRIWFFNYMYRRSRETGQFARNEE